MAPISERTIFSRDDLNLIVAFAGCSLDEKPGTNYVQENGGLPEYICRIAKAVKRSGKTTSQAIAIAISRVRKWAAGADDVDADTRAKAAKAVSEYEALLARTKAKTAAKKSVKASQGQGDILCLTTNFNVDAVRAAWEKQTDSWRAQWRMMNPNSSYSDGPGYSYIREMWTTYLIVNGGGTDDLHKVAYQVGDDGTVTFGDPVPVRTEYVVIDEEQTYGTQPTNSELRQLMATVGPCYTSSTDQVLLSITSRPSALDQVMNAPVALTAREQILATPLLPKSALEQVLRHGS